MGMTTSTRVTLCGTLAASIAGRSVHPALPGRKGRLLFARLTVGRDAPVSRDELIDAIWSEKPPADPDAAFSTLLTRTRYAVGRDVLQGRGELQLMLEDDSWIDWEVARGSASSAEARLGAGDQRAALDAATAGLRIVRQPFLPDMTAPWIEACRRELVELHAALLEAATKASLRMGGEHLATAERLARELIGREPYRESAYALLMNIHTARGNVAEALRVYDGLRRLLREELGLTPAHALTSLATQLLAEPDASLPTTAAPLAPPACLKLAARTQLVGRGAELQRLRAVRSEVMEGAARLAVVTGEAGIGKTRLAAELAIDAMGAGFDVLHGRAERDGATPYQPFVEAIRGVLRERPAAAGGVDASLQPELAELARLVPELRSTVAPPEGGELCSYRIFMAVSALLSTLAQERPVALVLDDLQYADAATLLLLRHVVRSAHAERVLIVATLRTDEPVREDLRAVLADLSGDGCLERVTLAGLSRADAAALAPDDDADRLWEQTAGNPFLIEALTRGDDDEQGDVPAAIRDAVDGRLLRLSGTGRRVILAAASAGESFDSATVAALSDMPPEAVADALSEAVRIGLLAHREPAGGLAFRHPIVQCTLLEAAGQPAGLR
jgi:DNA-binding SARP family transcriptional activator